ncbi:sensor histidine kinase [Arthrobacter celericrescens]|uniref:sensor histidine kinase n=1 Tax=Arthrobacter celericrescens TaxID=2320851 RepID=UPI000EA11BC3|nr:HAMP domain-containing sensor histidine kinase [Arthrobacter celericrescens]
MRLRVLGTLGVLAALLVVVVAAAILSSASRELAQEVQINRVSALNRFAQLAYDAALDGDSSQLEDDMDRYSALYGEGVLIRLPSGTLQSGGLGEDRAEVRNAVGQASLNLSHTTLPPVQAFGSGPAYISRSFGPASQVLGEAVLEVKLDAARQQLRERYLLVGLGAVVLWLLLLLGAARVTAWVLRPVHRLNSAAQELAARGKTERLPEAGPPELRELSRSFSRMAQTVSESMESQRLLIADTSHQLRNPVGALRLRLDLLQLKLRSAEEQAAAADVTAELERVEKILDGVLRLASAEHRASEGAASAGPDAEVPDIDPFAVLQEETDRARPAAEAAGVVLRLHPGPGLDRPALRLRCKPAELAHMVDELLANAIKYAPGSTVTVALNRRDGAVSIEVSDGGPGLSAEDRAAATSRFWRSPEHLGVRGTGLGMTIVDRLAKANGGRLVLEENSGGGLRARLEFPGAASHSGAGDG